MTLEFKSLTMMDFRRSPGSILDRVSKDGEAFVIERNGQQKACLVPVSVFLPDIQQSRFNEEINELNLKGKRPKISISATKEVEMRFQETVGEEKISIMILLPHGYPNVAPKVYASPIADNTPHRWQDGSLCIFGSIANWNPGKHNIIFLLTLTKKWLSNYDQWRKTGKWTIQEKEDL